MNLVKTKLIAIAGMSCSGKTTLANRVANQFDAPVISLDSYYLPLDEFTFEERLRFNFDDPALVDSNLLIQQLAALQRGETIDHPTYDFVEFTRGQESIRVEPSEWLILEGQYALLWPELRDLCAAKVYISAPDEICLDRRLRRDTVSRGRTASEVHWRFTNHVLPMVDRHMRPTKAFADLVLSGEDHPESLEAAVLEHCELIAR
jgi:uridine kinase